MHCSDTVMKNDEFCSISNDCIYCHGDVQSRTILLDQSNDIMLYWNVPQSHSVRLTSLAVGGP